jgi:ATP-binding cassette, subfamily B, bacterial
MSFPFYRQEDAKDCGPTCLKIISIFYGKDCDIGRIRDDAGLSEEGVSLFGLYTAALNLGFKAESVSLTFEELIGGPRTPAILHWGKDHFVVFFGTAVGTPGTPAISANSATPGNPDVIMIADPANGITRLTREEFCQHWLKKPDAEGRPVGVALLLEPAVDTASPGVLPAIPGIGGYSPSIARLTL